VNLWQPALQSHPPRITCDDACFRSDDFNPNTNRTELQV
jgi:hypothetical protein